MTGKNEMVSFRQNECRTAIDAGVARRLESRFRDDIKENFLASWDDEISGALAEQAVAKALGIYFDPTVNTFKDADIEPKIQVRCTQHKGGNLIFRQGDDPYHVYILVIDSLPRMRIVGWMYGYEANDLGKLKDGKGKNPPAYFVPQGKLHPFPLPNEIREQLGG